MRQACWLNSVMHGITLTMDSHPEEHGVCLKSFQVALVVKNAPAHAGDTRNKGSIPGSERSRGEGNGNPLQYSCLENPMGRGACLAGYSPWGRKELDMTEELSMCMHAHTHITKSSIFSPISFYPPKTLISQSSSPHFHFCLKCDQNKDPCV